MRIGVSLASSHADVTNGREGAARMVERARTAWEVGLDSLTIGDHHANARPYYQNTPMLGRLLSEWGGRPSGCLFLLPLWNPVLMAEQIGTLASIAQGPFIVQTGIGHDSPEGAAMNMTVPHRGRHADVVIPFIDALLAGETVTEPALGVVDAVISPTPPEPVRWWIGAMSAPGIDRAARLGGAWYGGPGYPMEVMAHHIELYREACAKYDTDAEIIIRQDCYVAETDAEAEAYISDLVSRGYRGGMAKENLTYGSAATVAERFADIFDLGAHEIAVRQVSLPPEEAVDSIARMGGVRQILRQY